MIYRYAALAYANASLCTYESILKSIYIYLCQPTETDVRLFICFFVCLFICEESVKMTANHLLNVWRELIDSIESLCPKWSWMLSRRRSNKLKSAFSFDSISDNLGIYERSNCYLR